jgi:catechol 2,3-dioxygenase-like lactoylglutathione lyase family enzyme
MDRPRLEGVLETCLYHAHTEREQVLRFYGETLALAEVAGWDDGVAFRVGPSVLLLFDRDRLAERDGPIADHGCAGPGHACLLTDAENYAKWKRRLAASGVPVTHEHEWSGGRRSVYFHDPAGNLLEIAEGDLWPAESHA